MCDLGEVIFLASTQSYDFNLFTGKEADTAIAMGAFSNTFGVFGKVFFSVMLPVFAFTTILAWSYYGEKSTEFIFNKTGNKGKKIAVIGFKILYITLIVLSAVLTSEVVWAVADISNALMALPNLVGLIILSGTVVKITKNYFARKKGENVEPMLSAYPDINEEFKEDLKKEEPSSEKNTSNQKE